MRCPKCGYNSFDHLENCKKCGRDLSAFKSRFGIKSVMLASAVTEVEEPAMAEEASLDAVETGAIEEPVAETVTEAAAAEKKSAGLEFDFIGSEDEEETLAFDELFEEPPPEDDADESLTGPEQESETVEEELADPDIDGTDAFDLNDSGLEQEIPLTNEAESLEEEDFKPDETLTAASEDLAEEALDLDERTSADREVLTLGQPDLGLDEAEEPEKTVSEATELGLDEEDLAEFKKQGIEGSTEDPDHPFGGKENLQQEGSSIIEKAVSATRMDDEPADFLNDQEALPLENLETTYGGSSYDRSAAGESDDFTLGTLPGAGLADIPELQAAEPERQEDTDEQQSETETEPDLEDEERTEQTTNVAPPFARRISAFLCDVILIGLVGLCFIVVAETALSERSTGMLPTVETLIDLSIPYFLVVFCLTFGYFTLFHFLTGQTPGKMVTGMRVETFSGEALAFSQAFMRSVGGLIQILPAGLGYLTILNAEGRGWNDRLAGTRLVDLKRESEEEETEVEEEVEEQFEEEIEDTDPDHNRAE